MTMRPEDEVRGLLRQRGVRLHDSVVADLATRAEVERLQEENARLLGEWRDADGLWIAAKAEVERLRAWINTEGRSCPPNAAVDAVLNTQPVAQTRGNE